MKFGYYLSPAAESDIDAVHSFIGPNQDIPAPDVYTNSIIMGWMMDEYSKIAGQYTPAVITGKPIPLGGGYGRDDATGRGAYICIEELAKKKNWKKESIRVAIQGFGNAGQSIAQLLHEAGYKVVGVTDSQGGIYNPKGFDVPSLIHIKNSSKKIQAMYCSQSICESVDATVISNEELLELDVDLLIPAAMENQITKDNAKKIKAPVIVEIANGPTTLEADSILAKKGVLIVPDVLANAGGVVVSYFEWVQNRAGFYWTKDQVNHRLQEMMINEFSNVYQLMENHKIDMRTGAYVHALNRYVEAVVAQGTRSYFDGMQGA